MGNKYILTKKSKNLENALICRKSKKGKKIIK